MSEKVNPNLSGVAETLLITLYIRAMEPQHPDALIKDERAEVLVRQMDQESLRKTLALSDDFSRVAVILKGREFDCFTQEFFGAAFHGYAPDNCMQCRMAVLLSHDNLDTL